MSDNSKVNDKTRNALAKALRVARAERNLTTDQLAHGQGFSGSAYAGWERAATIPERPSRVKLDKAMGWSEGTVTGFLDGELKSIDDVNPAVSKDKAASALKALLQASMDTPEPDKAVQHMTVRVPVEWSKDHARDVVEAAQRLAQQAIDALADSE